MKLQFLIPQYCETDEIIKPLLDSISIQQNVDFGEIGAIICNDGSDVRLSCGLLESYPYHIDYYIEPHRGVSGTRNACLDHATADYVMFYDRDKINTYFSYIKNCKGSQEYNEKHHIIPKSIGGINKKSNIISLSAEEHFYAHKLLYELFPECKAFTCAFWLMSHSNEETLEIDEFAKVRKEYSMFLSNYFHNNPNKPAENKKWINNGIKEKYINKDEEIPQGFSIGRLPCSNETRDKRSKNSKGKKWFNDGEKEYFLDPNSDRAKGLNLGRCNIGKWYTNGIVEIQVKNGEPIPIGFSKGRKPVSEETKIKMSQNNYNHLHGINEKTRKKMQEGYVKHCPTLGRHWYNNGAVEKLFLDCEVPSGFIKGRLKLL